ncbi:glycoside hydrolase family 36 protein [Myriangium duriaei CBS 260.36]|uniref:Glycoside hydrolase family 36 protein n=1 Tax=Myriangium duriaei CBS 260.36 TaxID=1168546 RepID=A0A9P4IRM2_9PEZI|nr:glycoside hydrolase family 36 protein [Myriangium duriaei CBS 260.36]
MFASITSWPPLGQTTVIPTDNKSIHFTVLLETALNKSSAPEDIEVKLWHNHTSSGEWEDAVLRHERDPGNTQLSVDANPATRTRRWYRLELPLVHTNSPTSFTVKFKTASQSGWRWVRDQTNVADGQLLFHKTLPSHDLSNFFDGLSTDLKITTPRCETPDTLLYSIALTVDASNGVHSGQGRAKLGYPTDSTRWFALVRLWAPWLAPRQGQGKFEIDKDAVLLSFLRSDGYHVVLLALSGVRDVTTLLVHDQEGNVCIQGRNDGEERGIARVLVAIAESFEIANSAVMYEARKIVMTNPDTTEEIEAQLQKYSIPPKPQWFEDWYDGFTYCTWNALGQDLTEQRILDALEDLKNSDIVIENLIIDDNWQSNTEGATQFERGWNEFEANKQGFPHGLKSTISKIRTRYPNIKHIAVWHAMMGYWGGVSPKSELAKRYKTTVVDIDLSVIKGPRTVIAASDITQMYDDFYSFLSSCGVDSVKTDVQFYLDQIVSAPSRRALITAYQDAWTLAQLRHFSARSISCMSQSPSVLFHSQIPTNRPTIPVRNSDDFFPEIEASHPWHIFCNAHNSLLTQHLNVVPDWDMFQTSHPWGSFHAAARCVSGGPIYFTDFPGKHNVELIGQMTARTADKGKRVILRPHRTGKTISAYAGYKDPALVKVGTYVGYARTGTAILGVFNCLENDFGEIIRLKDFPGAEGGEYIVRDFAGGVSEPMLPEHKASVVHVSLKRRGWAILSAHPVKTFAQRHGETKVALLGLVGQMTGIAGVLGHDVYMEDTGRIRIWVNLKAVGKLGVWVSNLPEKSVDENVMVLIGGTPIKREAVAVSKSCDRVLEVDYEMLWTRDQQSDKAKAFTWGNEVSLEVFIS